MAMSHEKQRLVLCNSGVDFQKESSRIKQTPISKNNVSKWKSTTCISSFLTLENI